MKRPNLTGRSKHPVQLRRDADLPSPRPRLPGRRCRIGNFLLFEGLRFREMAEFLFI
jgi:hypothetical protein